MVSRQKRMALSPPHKRVLRIPEGGSVSVTNGYAVPGGGSMVSACRTGNEGQGGNGVKEVRMRLGSINVGSLTGKGAELVKLMEYREISVACIQETRWKGSSARELGNGYKVYYAGDKSGRNGVGIVVKGELKDSIVEVKRTDSRLMMIKLVWQGITLNVVSAYAPQIGLGEEEKEDFWKKFDDLVCMVDKRDRLIIGGDLNGHVGALSTGYMEVHGDKDLG